MMLPNKAMEAKVDPQAGQPRLMAGVGRLLNVCNHVLV
jgi:hypothetical protein